MLDQHGREILIQEYKSDLKDASRQHRRIAKKKYQIEKNGRLETIDDRTAEDIKEQSIYAEIISSTKYALYWLEHGIERPLDEEAAKKYLNIAELNILQIWIRYHTKFIVTSMNLHVITLLLKRNKRC